MRTRTCAYQGIKNVRFSENLACFVFLKQQFWDSPLCLITDEIKFFVPPTGHQNYLDKSLVSLKMIRFPIINLKKLIRSNWIWNRTVSKNPQNTQTVGNTTSSWPSTFQNTQRKSCKIMKPIIFWKNSAIRF